MSGPGPFTAAARAYWRTQKRPWTPVRERLCVLLEAAGRPLGAEELWQQARREDGLVARSTVYRLLHDLRGAGLLRAVPTSGGGQAYVVVRTDTNGMTSIVCLDCGQTLPLEDPCLPVREGFLARQAGFHPAGMRLEIRAHCERHRDGGCAQGPGS